MTYETEQSVLLFYTCQKLKLTFVHSLAWVFWYVQRHSFFGNCLIVKGWTQWKRLFTPRIMRITAIVMNSFISVTQSLLEFPIYGMKFKMNFL